MAKLKKLVAALLLAGVLLPMGVRAVETVPQNGNTIEIPVYDMDILPGTWNPVSQMTAEKEFLLEMTSGSLYRVEAGVVTPSMAAVLPADVTGDYAGSFGIPVDAVRGYAFSIGLNEKACWEDGTAITADDWIFTIEQYLEAEKCYVNFAVGMEGAESQTVTGLEEAGFATVAQAREAGFTDFYLDISRFWGLEGGWMPLTDRTRLRDYAIPSGMDEFYVSPAYLYETYLEEGRAYDRWQPEMIGLAAENAREERPGYFKTGDGQLVLILNQPTTAAALAAQLENLRPLRSDIWGPEYATSAQNYSACGPYRVETVEPGLITLVRNENWYGQEDAQRPDLIRCKPMA